MLRRAARRDRGCRLISDVPLGAFLSGGVDSSADRRADGAARVSGPVKTFSIGFDEKTPTTSWSTRVWWRGATGPITTSSSSGPSAVEIFPDLVWHYNEPFADSSAIPTYYLSQLTRQHVTVAL